MIIAGETSGDLHGARLVNAMQDRKDSLFFCGVGGPALKAAGVRVLVDISELAVVGFTEVFAKLPTILRRLAAVKKLLKVLKPDLLILIDFPEFNLNVAAAAKKIGIPVLYYISPQIWAWRPRRVRRIGRRVDHMAVILPFEERFYQDHHVPVTYVGHPLLDSGLPDVNELLDAKTDSTPVIGLLPGSRESEITRHIPVMMETAALLNKRYPGIRFLLSHAPAVPREQLDDILAHCQTDVDFEVVSDDVVHLFKQCHLVVAASGTVTLQAAIYGIPMVIIYKVSTLSYWLGRALVRVNNIGLVNLIAGKEIVPEFIQHEACASNIATKVSKMLNDVAGRRDMQRQLVEIRDVLGGVGASRRVADIALGML
jgi:lipid-A-disaccharide synthase